MMQKLEPRTVGLKLTKIGHVDKIIVFDLNGPVIEPQTSCTDSGVFSECADQPVPFLCFRASIRGDFSNYIRLSIAYYEAEELQEASTRLCRAIKTAINEKRKL